MAQQRYTHQSIDPFTALSTYHVQRLERTIQEDHIAQQCQVKRRRTIPSVVGALWTWFRQPSLTYRRLPRHRPA